MLKHLSLGCGKDTEEQWQSWHQPAIIRRICSSLYCCILGIRWDCQTLTRAWVITAILCIAMTSLWRNNTIKGLEIMIINFTSSNATHAEQMWMSPIKVLGGLHVTVLPFKAMEKHFSTLFNTNQMLLFGTQWDGTHDKTNGRLLYHKYYYIAGIFWCTYALPAAYSIRDVDNFLEVGGAEHCHM